MTSQVYALTFRFDDPDGIIAVLGEKVTKSMFERIARGWAKISNELLSRHSYAPLIGEDVAFFSRTFVCDKSDLMINEEEQIEVISSAGQIRIRQLIIDEFGTGAGLKLGFSIAIVPVSGHEFSTKDIHAIESTLAENATHSPIKDPISPFANITESEFRKIIDNREVETYMQSIVDVQTNIVAGFEALTRGMLDSEVHRADKLFGSASHFGLSEELEFTCIEVALSHLPHVPEPYFLTINSGPAVLSDSRLPALLSVPGIKEHCHRLVFEITEHLPIADVLKLKESMHAMSLLGVRFALDDTGCGFFDLDTAVELKPFIVKLCISVIRQIDASGEITAEITETRKKLDGLNAMTLGEGVEEQHQLDALQEAGVQYYQGFLFDKPEPVQAKLASV